MFIGKDNELSRRAFLRRSGQLAVAGGASSYALGLAGMGELAAFSADDGYKALVCVFLYGGNDHNNTFVPFDAANYAAYSSIRGGNGEAGGGGALARADLVDTVLMHPEAQKLTNDIRYALAPTMPRMKQLFDEKAMAPLLNVGPLEVPLTRAQFDANTASHPRPAKLFSHNDQQSTWQASAPEGATVGWGGRMGDLAQSSNSNAIFTCINASGNAVFLAGQNALAYQISSNGSVAVNGVKNNLYRSGVASDALRALLTQPSSHVLAADHTAICKRSIEAEGFVSAALGSEALPVNFDDPSGANNLAAQLQVVARMIAARGTMGVKRQVFMVSLGGFDHHDYLMTGHPRALGKVDFALHAFYRMMQKLGVQDKVTTFTASDFGRTLAYNGDGSDHGWGSHHMIIGGAVQGGLFYGQAPAISTETDDQVGRGRLLPRIAVDQYSTTLAQWFGVSPSELPSIMPNIGRFHTADIGFMKKPAPKT